MRRNSKENWKSHCIFDNVEWHEFSWTNNLFSWCNNVGPTVHRRQQKREKKKRDMDPYIMIAWYTHHTNMRSMRHFILNKYHFNAIAMQTSKYTRTISNGRFTVNSEIHLEFIVRNSIGPESGLFNQDHFSVYFLLRCKPNTSFFERCDFPSRF